jgi:FemAB-related protein (PEP-CTERM system-associated)
LPTGNPSLLDFYNGNDLSVAIDPRSVESGVQVRFADNDDAAIWDEYVFRHRYGTPFHLTAWRKTIQQTFHYPSYSLIAMQDGRVAGIVPLFYVRNPLIGKALISSPFAVYGGALFDSPAVGLAFRDRLRSLANTLSVDYVELRNQYADQCLDFARIDRYVTFTRDLAPGDDAILQGIPRKTRYIVRRSLKEGFLTRQRGHEFKEFEKLYTANLRRLGTPAFPRKHFANLLANFGKMADIREVLLGERVVAAVLTLYFRGQVFPYYGASDAAYNAQAPSTYMYFDLMRSTAGDGYTYFDFGRSKKFSGGSYDFKSHWGMEVRDLPYEMLLVGRKQLPNYTPNNPAFRAPIALWRRVPLWITRLIGPHLVRLVP